MTAETRVQIEVVKNRDYLGGIYKGTAMITDGRYIVYIPEKDAIIEEIADVEIMILQIEYILGVSAMKLDNMIESKLDRQIERIKNAVH